MNKENRNAITFILMCLTLAVATMVFGAKMPITVEGLGSITLEGGRAFGAYLLLIFCYIGVKTLLIDFIVSAKELLDR